MSFIVILDLIIYFQKIQIRNKRSFVVKRWINISIILKYRVYFKSALFLLYWR